MRENKELLKLISNKKELSRDASTIKKTLLGGLRYHLAMSKIDKAIKKYVDGIAKKQAKLIYDQTVEFYNDIIDANYNK